MISALDQLSFDQALAVQQTGQQNSGSAGAPAQFAAQFAQMLAASQSQGQNQNAGQQQATPSSLTFSANTLATQVSQASQASQAAADPNAVIAAQIHSNLTAQAAATSATQTPEQAKSQQDSLVLQSLNYQASLAMSQGNIPAFMTFQALINKQMTSMGLIPEQAKAATAAAAPNHTAQNTPTAKKSTTKTSAKTAAAVAAAAASASQVAASNASTGSSASAQLTDTVLSNASTTGSSAAELASNASTTGSETAALASNAGTGGATTVQSNGQPNTADPADELDALQAELDALLADLEGESLDAALDALASITSKYGSAKAA